MTNRIIYDSYVGPPVFGIITAEDVLSKRMVFMEQLKNLVGFRTYVPKTEYEGNVFYELGYFAEMLYLGSAEAHTMINMSDDYVTESSHEMRMFKKESKKLVSMSIVENIMKDVLSRYETIKHKESFTFNKKGIKKLGYDKEIAYLCNLYLRLAKDVLTFEEFIVERKDADVIEAIKEGRFSESTIIKEIDSQIEEIKQLVSESVLPQFPSKDFVNKLIIKARGIEELNLVKETVKTR